MTTQAIFNEGGVKIIEKGVAVNSGLYERLMAHRLTVPLENSVTSTQTRRSDKFLFFSELDRTPPLATYCSIRLKP